MLRQRALHKGMDSRRGGHHGDHARGCQPQAASLDVLNLGSLGPPTWAYRGCRESCNSGTQETIPAHWNVAWSLCVNLQLMAHGPGLPSLFWKLLEVRDKEQISLNLHGTLN